MSSPSPITALVHRAGRAQRAAVKVIDDPARRAKSRGVHSCGVACIEVTEHMGFVAGSAFTHVFTHRDARSSVQEIEAALWFLRRLLSGVPAGEIVLQSPSPDVAAEVVEKIGRVTAREGDDVEIVLHALWRLDTQPMSLDRFAELGEEAEEALIRLRDDLV